MTCLTWRSAMIWSSSTRPSTSPYLTRRLLRQTSHWSSWPPGQVQNRIYSIGFAWWRRAVWARTLWCSSQHSAAAARCRPGRHHASAAHGSSTPHTYGRHHREARHARCYDCVKRDWSVCSIQFRGRVLPRPQDRPRARGQRSYFVFGLCDNKLCGDHSISRRAAHYAAHDGGKCTVPQHMPASAT